MKRLFKAHAVATGSSSRNSGWGVWERAGSHRAVVRVEATIETVASVGEQGGDA